MSDTPDFALIARHIASTLGPARSPGDDRDLRDIAEQLRAIWNARGRADIALIEAELTQIGVKSTAHLMKALNGALQALDR